MMPTFQRHLCCLVCVLLILHKVGMLQGRLARNTPFRIVLQEFVEQVSSRMSIQGRQGHKVGNESPPPLRKFRIVMRESQDTRPHFRRGRPPTLKDFENLINVGPTRKQGHTRGHFGKYATDTPHVDRSAVAIGAEEQFGGAVPQGDDFECVRAVGNGGESCETEVG
jgi:hypothetical protein